MIIYCKKFKNNVKNKFLRYDDNIENIKNFIKISIEFDDKFYEKIMKKYYNSREKLNIYVKTSNFRDNNNKNRRNDINYEITSMKLNVTIRRKKKNFKKNKNKKKQKLCYECEQSSYFARKYTTRNNVRRRKFNILLKIIFDN